MSRTVAALLLAAGRSRRMGRCKQLLALGETTVIGRCLRTLQQGGVNETVVVVSQDGQEVAAAAEAAGVCSARVVVNRSSDGDMASSIMAGRAAVDPEVSGVIIALCDYPLVTPATIKALLSQHDSFPERIITPRHQQQGGHPLLVPRTILDDLKEGMTLRDLLGHDKRRVQAVAVDDPGILIDMDTPEDYLRIRNILKLG